LSKSFYHKIPFRQQFGVSSLSPPRKYLKIDKSSTLISQVWKFKPLSCFSKTQNHRKKDKHLTWLESRISLASRLHNNESLLFGAFICN